MTEEIKKEAQDVELNPEELDTVAGGYTEWERTFYKTRFIFEKWEVSEIKDRLNVTLEADRMYTRRELNDLGFRSDTDQDIRDTLASIGIYKS